ncbi:MULTISPECIES: cobalamin B12-binding domain-containing protein [Streptomyces]|uniref:cobalamin B12-binding domain-containing protein n=1 Tax=Streptomyces TaxID=1883 RepID=UPI001586FE70|nr:MULTISPECIES: cobalamin-dependent protein [Streptomyces]MCX4743036.1 cobalamin-dependent protein [Streptomyces antibioticus]NUV64329.1 methylaspartate mutase [Streptomyces sp. CAI-85]
MTLTDPRTETRRTVVVTSMASDSHTWNLVFLQLLLEELGLDVVNLGPCVPDDLLIARCAEIRPAFVVISSVNGHGHQDGLRVIRALRGHPELCDLPAMIGGKLGVDDRDGARAQELRAAGFDDVVAEGTDPATALARFAASLPTVPSQGGSPGPLRTAL